MLLPAVQVRGAVAALGDRTLQVGEDLPHLGADGDPRPGEERPDEQHALLLVPDAEGRDRAHLLRLLRGRSAVVGPARAWTQARTSYLRAVRALALAGSREEDQAVDSEQHLAELVVGADPEALADLRGAVLAPLEELREATAQKLADTLRAWLLLQGRRDAVAEHLHVHPQTVRYRMGQLRELYGDRLDDPRTVLELVLALPAGPVTGSPDSPPERSGSP